MLTRSIFALYIMLIISSSQASANLTVSIDGALFRYDDNTVLWELYYAYYDNTVSYRQSGNQYISEINFEISLISYMADEHIESWVVSNKLDYLPGTVPKASLVGQRNFILNPGIYEVILRARDNFDTNRTIEFVFRLPVKKIPKNTISVSDIQLARLIEAESNKSGTWLNIFNKNSLYVIPNPTLEYFDSSPLLKAYIEVYNARMFATDGYNIYFNVYDALQRNIFTSPGSSVPISDGMVEIAELPLEILPTGKYFFEIVIEYGTGKVTDSVKAIKPFYYLNSNIPPEQASQFIESETFEASEFSTMTPDEVAYEYITAKFIANPDEIDRFESLTTLEAKQRFLYAFWMKRDPDPNTIINEKLFDHRKAIEHANKYYSYGTKMKGWRTDRGRILLTYGFPTYIQRKSSDREKPHEIWHYDELQGGAIFCFVDVLGYNNFILVHSTLFGEIANNNWFDEYVPLGLKQDLFRDQGRRY